ncbi:MBL fold metallo-hydrolase [Candidatus Altiarchaeales archaeon WOR_SM1_SCG]|nr:MBL fold metallo-hydrolase [Candidatus Altiarchaeales archaeon WOR_SM1_SCG]
MKITFLGTNGWYDTETGNTICTLIESDKYFIILDAGNGIYKIDRYIKSVNKKLVYLFISHFHLDHIIGLHILNKFKFSNGLRVYGPAGTKEILDNIINAPYTVYFAELPFKVDICELSEGLHRIPFLVECKPLLHSSTCMGYRFELDDKIIMYCPDTGFCENAIELAKNADLLITECSFKSGQRNPKWPHLNPEDAAQIAKDANAKKLVLTHFDANIYKTSNERKLTESQAKKIFINSYAAFDNIEVVI